MKVLITGGCGFIGSHLAEYFQNIATEIRIIDNLRSGYEKNIKGFDTTWIQGSITDRNLVKKAMEDIDYIFHMAAMVSVPESMEKPAECVDINVSGLLNVLEEASAAGAKKIVLASSAAIYGDNLTVPKLETMRAEPKSPYAITKLDGEHYLEMFQHTGRIKTASLRFFNVFGPRQDPKGAYAAAVPIFIEQAFKNEPITIFGDGEATRDFIYIKDIVNALVFVAMNETVSGTYNAGYNSQLTIFELAQKIIAQTNSTSQITYTVERTGDVKHSRASNEKLINAGWKPEYTLDKGLTETITFYQQS
jgi:UDP-glucose 4-epimerase